MFCVTSDSSKPIRNKHYLKKLKLNFTYYNSWLLEKFIAPTLKSQWHLIEIQDVFFHKKLLKFVPIFLSLMIMTSARLFGAFLQYSNKGHP